MQSAVLRVIFFEQNEDFLQAIEKSNEGAAAFLFCASDEPALWSLLETVPVDAVVLDLNYCVKHSTELLLSIKRHFPDVIILLMKDPNQDYFIPQNIKKYTDGVIDKSSQPVDVLIKLINNYVSAAGSPNRESVSRLLSILRNASSRVLKDYDPDAFVQVILDAMVEMHGTHNVGVFVRNINESAFRVIGVRGEFTRESNNIPRLGMFSQLVESEPRIFQANELGWSSALMVPVERSGLVFMFLAARNNQQPDFTEIDLSALILLSHMIILKLDTPQYQKVVQSQFQDMSGGIKNQFFSVMDERSAHEYGQVIDHKPSLIKDSVVFLDKKRIVSDGIASIHLTLTEARLFNVLWQKRNELVLHIDLVQLTHGYSVGVEEASKILRPVVSRLRKKLSIFPGGEDWIKNVRGTGYVLGDL